MWVLVRTVAIWVFGDDIVKYTLYGLAGLVMFAFLESSAAVVSVMSQPFGQHWLAGVGGGVKSAVAASAPLDTVPSVFVGTVPVPLPHAGTVSDVERYLIARAVGFLSTDLILAVAISIAENGWGDPARMSAVNWNGTYDLGLWQINSIHWAGCGGREALTIPIVNGRCAVGILGPGRNWCAWSTYEESCGVGHDGSYRAQMARARAAAAAAQGGE